MWKIFIVMTCIGRSMAAITGSNPAIGACLCASAASVNVRSTACGTVIGTISTGQCYKYSGTKQTCVLSGVSYEFLKIDYGSGAWVAASLLNYGTAFQCPVTRTTTATRTTRTTTVTPTGCPRIVTRAEWGARSPTSTTSIAQPIPRVFIHHTETASCTTQSACSNTVRSIQNYHMDSNGWADIGYNFLVGEDGNVYEGRGWNRVGAHSPNWNSLALGISMIGNFTGRLPNVAALNTAKQLIACGTSLNKVSSSYSLHGHRDGTCTLCPGQILYNLIKTWPKYGGKLSGSC